MLSNTAQASASLQIYLADYDDVYPAAQSMPSFRAVLNLYIKNGDLFLNRYGYPTLEFNFALAGVADPSLKDKDNVLLLINDYQRSRGRQDDGTMVYATASGKKFKSKWNNPAFLAIRDLQFPRATQQFFPPDYLANQDPLLPQNSTPKR